MICSVCDALTALLLDTDQPRKCLYLMTLCEQFRLILLYLASVNCQLSLLQTFHMFCQRLKYRLVTVIKRISDEQNHLVGNLVMFNHLVCESVTFTSLPALLSMLFSGDITQISLTSSYGLRCQIPQPPHPFNLSYLHSVWVCR